MTMNKKNLLMIIIGMTASLAAGALLGRDVSLRQVQAESRSSMENKSTSRWESKAIRGPGTIEDLLDKANALGNEGWEVVGASELSGHGIVILLKRPKS